jgi:hypothetical protein
LLHHASQEVVTNITCLPIWEFMRKTEPHRARQSPMLRRCTMVFNVFRRRQSRTATGQCVDNLYDPLWWLTPHNVLVDQPENALRHFGKGRQQNDGLLRKTMLDVKCHRFQVHAFRLVVHQDSIYRHLLQYR